MKGSFAIPYLENTTESMRTTSLENYSNHTIMPGRPDELRSQR
jgi:hypothetical protein